MEFDKDFIRSLDFFGKITIFTMLILLTHEYRRSFYLMISFLFFYLFFEAGLFCVTALTVLELAL